MAIFKLSRAERKRISAFFTCLFLAMLAWIFVVMSKSYTFPVKVALNYKNHPERKAFFALQADTVLATVGGTGWQRLFSAVLPEKNRIISVDLRKLETQNFIVLSNQLQVINQKNVLNQQIYSFSPDTVFFDFALRKVKRVPIILKTDITFQRQFARSDDILFKPDFVTISGPAVYVDSVKSWPTDTLVLNKVNTSIAATLKLVPPQKNNVSINPKTVDVKIPVDEFTEKTLEVPVKLLNNKTYSKVSLFPKKIKITFMVSLDNYPAVNADFFEVVADLNSWQQNGMQKLPVKLNQQPDYCKIVDIQPAAVNFIVHK
ncbi:YbbR-like domain-containing protein [Mucilaginibacter sp.]|uniref:YbbR-like domain-containing protein n=1 Tax=Mucilaginibacter sp. TaxID=1882438 RepID=UPI003B009BA6